MTAFPMGWTETTLGEVATYVTSGSRDWSKYYSQAGSLFIRTQDINKNELCDLPEIALVSLPNRVEGKRTLVHKGDLLITITGANVGKCAEVRDHLPEAYVSQSVALVRLAYTELSAFLHRQLVTPTENTHSTELEKRAYGLGRPVLSLNDVREVAIRLAPLPEQRRIVAKVDSLTSKSKRARDHLNHIPRLAEKYKQAILAAAFRGDLTRDWRRTRCPDEEWLSYELGRLIDEGPSNGWSPKSGPDAIGAFTLKLTATTSGSLRLDEAAVKRIYETPRHSSPYWLRSGDLLVQRANSLEYLGAAAIYDGPANTFIYPDLMMRLRIKEEATRRYIWRFLNSEQARGYFRRHATGTAGNMPKISGGTLRSLAVPLAPSAKERSEVVRRIEVAFAWIDRLAKETTSARHLIDQLDQAVLAKAFRGELVPQDPADEPASMLLERIRAERSTLPRERRGRRARA